MLLPDQRNGVALSRAIYTSRVMSLLSTSRTLPILFEEAIFSKIGVDDAYPLQSWGYGRMSRALVLVSFESWSESHRAGRTGPKAYQGIKYFSFLE